VLVNPLSGLLADRSFRRRGVMVLLAAINLAGFLLFVPIDGLWPLLLVNALTTTAASSLLPLGETLALGIVYAKQLDYGRIRLWGSVSFILGALGAGAFVTAAASEDRAHPLDRRRRAQRSRLPAAAGAGRRAARHRADGLAAPAARSPAALLPGGGDGDPGQP